ncbi:MAG: hypothetical protein AAB456_01675 [Patescibacteria group bacterium]
MKFYHNHPRQYLLALIVGAAILLPFLFFINGSLAAEIFDRNKAIEITKTQGGPGGCKTEADCTTFCNGNQEACMTWAKDNGVMSNDKFDKYIDFAKQGGPGGCKTPDSCKSYCEDKSHFDSCISSGEKLGIISPEQAKKARKTGPGGCITAKECQTFCEQPQNEDVCLDNIIQEEGSSLTQEQAQSIREFNSKAREFRDKVKAFKKRSEDFKAPGVKFDPGFDETKAKQIIETKGGPGGCKTFEECKTFCDNPANQEVCFKFAEEQGLFKNKGEADKIKRIIKEGGPGGCKGEQECKQFCENDANFETCIGFAEKSGLLAPEEVQKAKKGIQAMKEGGPAGCKTKEACDKVCRDPANQEACFEWAKKNGFISEEEVKFMEEFKKVQGDFEKRRGEFESGVQDGPGGFQGQQGQFQGQQGEFPGRPGEFPGGGRQGGFQPPQGFQPPAGFQVPEGFKPPEGFKEPEGFKLPEGFRPPEGFKMPEGFKPPEGFQSPPNFQPPAGTFTPPPGFVPPPGLTPPPATQPQTLIQYSPFGAILNFFLGR